MKNIVLYNPAIATFNVGDEIIYNSASLAIKNHFEDSMFIDLPTQMPVSKKMLKRFSKFDYKFVCGSNLLQNNMLCALTRKGLSTHGIRQWDFCLSDVKKISPVILIGCGWQNYNSKTNFYTKKLWKRLLSDEYIHSVRDSYTAKKLNEIGINNVVNTSCPTTWMFTPDFCKDIPTNKAERVVTTLTYYRPDKARDENILKILLENYRDVFLWPQGVGDLKYFEDFSDDIKRDVKILGSSLKKYESFLENNEVDYVGSRLHGGIFSIQKKKRSIIIGLDNRAVEINKDINLKVVNEVEVCKLETEINGDWKTYINLPQENINKFLNQFTDK